MFMNLLDLLDRIYIVLDKLDPKHPNVKKVNKILSTAEKAILSWAKIIWIRIDDIKEIKNLDENKDKDKDTLGDEEPKEGTPEEESKETPAEEAAEPKDDEGDGKPGDGKRIKIRAMFGNLPDDKKEEFKWKMGDKFNSLWL